MILNKGKTAYTKPKKVKYLHVKNTETMLQDITDFLMYHTMQYYAEDESFYNIKTKSINNQTEYMFYSFRCYMCISPKNSKECYIVFEPIVEEEMFIDFKVYNPEEFHTLFEI